MSDEAEKCWAKAAECRTKALATQDFKTRQGYLELAESWTDMAKKAERRVNKQR